MNLLLSGVHAGVISSPKFQPPQMVAQSMTPSQHNVSLMGVALQDTIFKQGDTGQEFFVIRTGEASVFVGCSVLVEPSRADRMGFSEKMID